MSTSKVESTLEAELDGVIEAFRDAIRAYVKGEPDAVVSLFSTRDDVTLANPLGPPRRGPSDVKIGILEGSKHFQEGGSVRFATVSSQFEEVSRYATQDLAYVVQMERSEGRLARGGGTVAIALRVTMIFRPEEGGWKVVHRHADPITSTRPISTAFES